MKIVACSNAKNFVKSLINFPNKDLVYNEILRFEDGEMLVKIDKAEELQNKNVLIIQSISSNINDAIIELLFTLDLVKNAMPKSIYLLITYLGYSRQDKIPSISESFSSKILLNILSFKYISRIFIINIHALQTMGFFEVPSVNILTEDIMIENIKKRFNTNNIVLVSPDIGNAKNIINMSNKMNVEYTIGIKYRPKANESVLSSLSGCNVEGKTCIIVDDIVDSAGTICNVANLLKEKGAQRIYAFLTHAVLSSKSFERITNSPLEKMFVSNTIDCSDKIHKCEKLEVISISEYCIENIKKYVK